MLISHNVLIIDLTIGTVSFFLVYILIQAVRRLC